MKHILFLFTFIMCLSLTSCGDTDPTYEGTLKTGYVTIPEPGAYLYFSLFRGVGLQESSGMLYSFMTDENRKYWEAFEYSDNFSSEEEMLDLKDRFEKRCISHYNEQLALLRKENLNEIFNNAADTCVFTARVRMTLYNFSSDYDTVFVVQRPILNQSLWTEVNGAAPKVADELLFLDDSTVEYTSNMHTDTYNYRRDGNTVYMEMEGGTVFMIHITTTSSLILYDNTGENKIADFRLNTLPVKE